MTIMTCEIREEKNRFCAVTSLSAVIALERKQMIQNRNINNEIFIGEIGLWKKNKQKNTYFKLLEYCNSIPPKQAKMTSRGH